ncbi:MAG: hypothetical protein V4671_21115 [Armatimonadota bacterium]
MNTESDQTIPRQRPHDAPHENKDTEGRIVGDSTESNGIGETAWGTTADLTPENADEASSDGYTNSNHDFQELHLDKTDEPSDGR